jgi:hypothetical protein
MFYKPWMLLVGMAKAKFPKLMTVVLIFALIWFAKEMDWLSSSFDFPWLPAIIAIIAFGSIVNNYN